MCWMLILEIILYDNLFWQIVFLSMKKVVHFNVFDEANILQLLVAPVRSTYFTLNKILIFASRYFLYRYLVKTYWDQRTEHRHQPR